MAVASAQVTSVGSITPTATEDFESYGTFGEFPSALFGGAVGVDYLSGTDYGGIRSAGSWSLYPRDNSGFTPVIPQSGDQFLALPGWAGGGSRGSIRLNFDSPVYQFGGYFSDILGGLAPSYGLTEADAYTFFDFYVADGFGGESILYSTSIDLISEDGELHWAGFASNVAFSSVVVSGWEIPMDDLVISSQAVPEPASIAALGLGGLALLRRRRKSA
ncbi:PEP-CTERM sorting domain-containing protein [bacterium]|nr:MAG: PEP-CTERM sorting domain-containing protein [bacterium]